VEKESSVRITKSQALRIGNKLKVNWNKVDLEQLRQGMQVESEHKSVVGNSMTAWAKVALAHLTESGYKYGKNYYSRLKKVER
jgi:hypothetical protein